MTTSERNRTTLIVAVVLVSIVAALLLVYGFITSEQWTSLVGSLFGPLLNPQ